MLTLNLFIYSESVLESYYYNHHHNKFDTVSEHRLADKPHMGQATKILNTDSLLIAVVVLFDQLAEQTSPQKHGRSYRVGPEIWQKILNNPGLQPTSTPSAHISVGPGAQHQHRLHSGDMAIDREQRARLRDSASQAQGRRSSGRQDSAASACCSSRAPSARSRRKAACG
jgi:hypothetical protein